MLTVLMWFAGLATLAGFWLFLPVFLLAGLNRRQKASGWLAGFLAAAALLVYVFLFGSFDDAQQRGDIAIIKANRYAAPILWSFSCDNLWGSTLYSPNPSPEVWQFLLKNGSSPAKVINLLSISQYEHMADKELAILVDLALKQQSSVKPDQKDLKKLLLKMIREKFFKTVLVLARHGVGMSMKIGSNKGTLLHAAAIGFCSPELLQEFASLLGSGSWLVFDGDGKAPVHYLSVPAQLQALPAASETARLLTKRGTTLLHLAVENGRMPLFNELIGYGFATDTPDSEGTPPFLYATDLETYRSLKPATLSAELTAPPLFNRLLENALYRGSTEFIELVYGEVADRNFGIYHGSKPLHRLLQSHKLSSAERAHWIKRLVSAGADVNLADSVGNTPLHCAVYNSRHDEFKLLLDLKADVNRRNQYGKTILSLMRESYGRDSWSEQYHRLILTGMLAEAGHPADLSLPDWNHSFPSESPDRSDLSKSSSKTSSNICRSCGGSGKCSRCQGRGLIGLSKKTTCYDCFGKGRCFDCDGKGKR